VEITEPTRYSAPIQGHLQNCFEDFFCGANCEFIGRGFVRSNTVMSSSSSSSSSSGFNSSLSSGIVISPYLRVLLFCQCRLHTTFSPSATIQHTAHNTQHSVLFIWSSFLQLLQAGLGPPEILEINRASYRQKICLLPNQHCYW